MNDNVKLNHEQFLQQFVLNSCKGQKGEPDGWRVAGEAEKAWRRIQLEIKEANKNE